MILKAINIDEISALVGSCTIHLVIRAASIANNQSQRIKQKFHYWLLLVLYNWHNERDGQMQSLKDIGATVLANACGACIGQW